MQKLTGFQPSQLVETLNEAHFKDLHLADPAWRKPRKIDMLLDAAAVAAILKDGLLKVEKRVSYCSKHRI